MNTDQFKELLRNRSLRATKPRLKLLHAIEDYASAMPYSAIQKAMSPIDRVTLYRTLESLTSNGVIHKALQEGTDVFYAICGHRCAVGHHKHDHIHFKCQTCNTVTCEKPIEGIEILLPEYEIHKVAVAVEGICPKCSK
jgi:Fur family ferric uptake transcriptional regulator